MQAALTSAVQAGFVVGCLVSAFFGLADRLDPRRFIAAAALLGAVANATAAGVDPTTAVAPLLRFVTGVAMAGVYPVGMKLASTWARGDMGLMVGILVGALTLGSAAPHLFNAVGGVDWRIPVALRRQRRRRCAADRVRRNRARTSAGPALRSARRGGGVARRAVAARQPRLPRPYVGALCDVGVDRRVPARELRTDVAAGRRVGAREARRVRDRRGRRDRLRRRRAISPIALGALRSRSRQWCVSGRCAVVVGLLYGGSQRW